MQKLVHAKYPDVFVYKCNLRSFKAIEELIIQRNCDTLSEIYEISRFFVENSTPYNWLITKTSAKTPVVKKDYALECLLVFIGNFQLYKDVISDHDEFDSISQYMTIKSKLNNTVLLSIAMDVANQLKAVSSFIKIIDEDENTMFVPKAVEMWIHLIQNR